MSTSTMCLAGVKTAEAGGLLVVIRDFIVVIVVVAFAVVKREIFWRKSLYQLTLHLFFLLLLQKIKLDAVVDPAVAKSHKLAGVVPGPSIVDVFVGFKLIVIKGRGVRSNKDGCKCFFLFSDVVFLL